MLITGLGHQGKSSLAGRSDAGQFFTPREVIRGDATIAVEELDRRRRRPELDPPTDERAGDAVVAIVVLDVVVATRT